MEDLDFDPLFVQSEAYGYLGLHNTAFSQRVVRGTMVAPDEVTFGGRRLWRKSTLDHYLKNHKEGQKYIWPPGA